MAQEIITKIELTNTDGFPRRMTVASAAAIAKGSLMALSDPRTAAASRVAGEVCCGVASMDKAITDSDRSTEITVWTDGIMKSICSGTIHVGSPLSSAGPSGVMLATLHASGAKVIGYSFEEATNKDTLQWRLRL